MNNKILIAIDDCVDSKKAVQYAVKTCSAAKNTKYTLFYVQPVIPQAFTDIALADSDVKAEVDELAIEKSEVMKCMCGSIRDVLVREGVPENCIETVSETIQLGIVKDIITRAKEGNYHAIVLARRGLTPSRDFFLGPCCASVVEHSRETPVWIVDGVNTSMNFMLAVDGSEHSFKCVDYVIDIASANPDLRVTVFHVLPHLRHYYSMDFEKKSPKLQEVLHREDNKRMEDFFEIVNEKFRAAGLKTSQIKTKTETQSYDISTAILKEARTGGYDTVVIGRRGERDAFFTGRIATRVVQSISKQTLWVIP
jgi:nucleotide-binding universal stress UspA family protein